MDVTKRIAVAAGAVAGLFFFTACSNKTAGSVFNNSSLSAACSGEALQTKFIVEWEDGHVSVEHGESVESFKENFIQPNLENIRLVEADRRIHALSEPVAEQSVSTSALNDGWGQEMIRASALWNQGIKGQGVLVGVVDAYVDVNHSQLSPRIAVNSADIYGNGLDDDGNGYIDDTYGAVFVSNPGATAALNKHGTHVSGIIAADHNSGPIKGVAPLAKIIPGQFIANDGTGSIGDAILALQYVTKRGARVINASWGGTSCLATLRNQFESMANQGVFLVVAAGNDGTDIDVYPDFPAAFGFGNQLTVAASTIDDFMPSWSNKGFSLVHLAAPGENILSLAPGNSTITMSGTSMAAPFVTGAVALLLSAKPNASVAQIRQALMESVDVTPNHEFKVYTHGRMNVQKALARLQQLVP